MASRKVKHAKAVAKRQAYFAHLQAENALVLQKARDRREREQWEAWRDNHDKRHQSDDARVDECPLCKAGVWLSRKS